MALEALRDTAMLSMQLCGKAGMMFSPSACTVLACCSAATAVAGQVHADQ
jgi:hypothetical protein